MVVSALAVASSGHTGQAEHGGQILSPSIYLAPVLPAAGLFPASNSRKPSRQNFGYASLVWLHSQLNNLQSDTISSVRDLEP